MWLLIFILILKITALGISSETPSVGPVILICILALTLLGGQHQLAITWVYQHCDICIQPRHVFTSVSVFLC